MAFFNRKNSGGAIADADTLAKKIEEAEAQLTTLQAEAREVALGAVTAGPGSAEDAAYGKLRQDEAATLSWLQQLRDAKAAADAKVAAEQREAQKVEINKRVARAEKRCEQQLQVWRIFVDHLAKAADAYQQLHGNARDIHTMFPNGAPAGTLLTSNEIAAVVGHELHRLCGNGFGSSAKHQFQTQRAPTINTQYHPHAVLPVIDAAKEAHVFLRTRLEQEKV